MVHAVLKKRVSRKTRLKFWAVFIAQVAVWETPDTPQEKREIKQKKKFSCVKPFASYSKRFKLNFKTKKNDFLKNLHWCCPLTEATCIWPLRKNIIISILSFISLILKFMKLSDIKSIEI